MNISRRTSAMSVLITINRQWKERNLDIVIAHIIHEGL